MVVIQSAHNPVAVKPQADLLFEFSQYGLFGTFTRIDAAARQGPLAGVIAQMGRSSCKQNRCVTVPRIKEGDIVDIGITLHVDDGNGDRRRRQ
jgi:hypothetical protein